MKHCDFKEKGLFSDCQGSLKKLGSHFHLDVDCVYWECLVCHKVIEETFFSAEELKRNAQEVIEHYEL
jgi:hypothetical protein